MKKQYIPMLIVAILLFQLMTTVSLAQTIHSENQLETIEAHFQKHGYVLKRNFWANNSRTAQVLIKDLQNLYNNLGYPVSIDGCWGPEMETTTKRLQQKLGVTADGKMGTQTFSALMRYARTTLLRELADGVYVISPRCAPKLAMDVAGGSTSNGANIQIYPKNQTSAQMVHVEYQNNGYYRLTFLCSNKVLDVSGGSRQSTANVQQYNWNGTDAQLWKIAADGDYYHIINKGGWKYLDVCNGSQTAGTNVWVYNGNGTAAQDWKFTPINNMTTAGNREKNFENQVFSIGHAQLGKTYKPYGGNSTTAWCGYYVRYVLKQALQNTGVSNYTDVIPYNRLTGAVGTAAAYQTGRYGAYYSLTDWYYNGTRMKQTSDNKDYTPQPGDVILIETNNVLSDGPDHLGIVIRTNSDGSFITSEGNTGTGNTSTRTVKEYTYVKSGSTWKRKGYTGVNSSVHVICTVTAKN
ncbi:CHAP domain-containing protein [Ruminococcaceae bacterium AM07-15]|nr:CHAP domain-containing protein [Ruminococcaceae bacterium AM07-15]